MSNEARHDWIEQEGAQDRSVTGRNYQRVADFQMSTTDPDATIMLSKDGAHLGYQTHYVVDGGKARIILAALVAPAEVMENQPMLDLVFRTCFRWKLRPRRSPVIANTAPKRILSPWKLNTFARIWRFLTPITVLHSLARIASAMSLSVMFTSVRQAKNCTSLPGIPQSVPCAIAPKVVTAIAARSRRSVPLASRDAASAAVSMRRCWSE